MSIAPYDRERAPSTLELSDTISGARPDAAATGGLSDALAGARPGDPAALALAQARVAGALFGGGASFGRFHVLERLGSGGMGAVYAAYDPELDRGVALKMVHVADRRDAALAEAKALARLAHPNVVPVFDVGLEGDDVYIVMELVRGETLRRWVRGRSASEVLDVYRQAAAALAAAHAAGLVHRDFKPDNAIVGHDGRVRVVDFGLACEASEQRTPAGTPGYMPPEQAAGGAVSPAADQYSFCVSLGEALDDARAAGARPAWLAAILTRGTASAPGDRFASMAELLHALGRDPAKLRRRRVVAGLAATATAAAVATAFFVGRASPAAVPEPSPCEGGDAEIAAAWPPEARTAALDRIAGLGAYGSELAPRLRSQLDDYAQRWATGRRDACLAHMRGLQSSALFDRRTLCLDRARAAVETVAKTAVSSDAAALPTLAEAAASLPELDACDRSETLGLDIAPPPERVARRVKQLQTDLTRMRIEIVAGHIDEVRTWLDIVVEQAREIGYQPLLAEALLVTGQLLATADDRDRAVPALREASWVAVAAKADAIAIEAWGRWARLAAISSWLRQPDGRDAIEALAAHASCDGTPRAMLYSNLGAIEFARGHRSLGRAALERALAERSGAKATSSVELATIERGFALATDDRVERDAILARLEAAQAQTLGVGHPQTLLTRYTRATSSVVSLSAVASILTDTCDRWAAYPALNVHAATCWAHLADVRRELGDIAGSNAAFEQAVRLDGEHDPEVPDLMPYHALWRGDTDAAIRQFQTLLAGWRSKPDPPWFDVFARARITLGLLRAEREAGRPRDLARLREVVEVFEAAAREHPATARDRQLARARTELAYSGVRSAETISAARAALAWWRLAGANPQEIAKLERWITGALDSPR